MSPAPPFRLAVPGPLDQATGGYRYAARIVEALASCGQAVAVHELPGTFPDADDAARAAAARLAAAAHDETLVIDGLALPAFADVLQAHRPRWVALVHHPLALETGIGAARRAHLAALEPALIARLAGVIVTSPATARDVAAMGVASRRIAVVLPGTDRPAAARRRRSGALRLLCVATLTPRKAHDVLLRALRSLRHLRWRLDCVGSERRDLAWARHVRALVRRFGLGARVRFRGELPAARLPRAYRAAHLFVLPSRHEGYGMAFAEAIAHGLPIVACRAGAVPETVPAAAGLLARPGDARDLARLLGRAMAGRGRRERLARGARHASRRLPTWPEQAGRFARAVERLSQP